LGGGLLALINLRREKIALMGQILQFLFSGLTNGAVYAVIALGFTIIYNATDVINFAQGEFVMLGAMVMYTFVHFLSWPIPVAFFATIICVSVIGILVEFFTIRPAKNADIISLIIITIGVSIFLRGVAMMIWGKDPVAIPPFTGSTPIVFMGAAIDPQIIWVLVITLIAMIFTQWFFKYTIWGKAMRACAVNKKAAKLVGIKVERLVSLSFALSAGISAAAGAVIAPITFASYDMGTMLGLKGFCAAVLGGLGSGVGSILGGFILGILEAFGAGYISSSYKDAFAFLILLIVLFLKPQGLLGQGEVDKL